LLTVIRSRVVRDCTSFRRCALLGCYAACVDVCIKVSGFYPASLLVQGPTLRDRLCVLSSGSVWAGTNASGPIVCPIIRVCLGRDQRFGTDCVSYHQGLFVQGPTLRDRLCVLSSGSVWAGTNASGPIVCPIIRVCLGRDQRFGTDCVSYHQGLFGQGPLLRDRLCVLSPGSVWAGTNASGSLLCPIIRVCLGRDQRFETACVSYHQGLIS
jgi:hypothetical protein